MIGLTKQVHCIKRDDAKYYIDSFDVTNGVERTHYDTLIKNISCSELQESATLYFSKSSTFPRIKLENSKFKRCIKIDKADYVVINPKTISNRVCSSYYIETDDKIILGSYYQFYYRRDEVEKDLGIKIDNVKTLYFYELTEKREDLIKLIQNPNLKLITDDMLNVAINKTDQLLDLDTANMILDMLCATDNDSVELGLKMLTGFNISKTPLTISTMLLLNNRWYSTNARTNVLVSNMLKQLDILNKRVGSSFPYCIKYIGNIETNDYDKSLAKSLIFEKTKTYINGLLESEINFFKKYNINITVEID